ncbi:hypothetical protein [Streptomyces katrae]|uniref:hypothetical protein n=1 Tax=Streptomyces katrae TaxID=68223 RepID=UPI0013317D1D|nr:hypothetical protein [Streptomyces katrae]
MSTLWTRLTGWLTLLAGLYAAVHSLLIAILPSGLGATTAERLLPTGIAILCGTAWLTASVAARPRTASWLWEPRPSRILPIVLGITVVLTSAAALVQASGPDGADGRQLRSIHQAGAVERDVKILALRSEPRRLARVNRSNIYRTAVDLSVPFVDGPRTVTVDVETPGPALIGEEISVQYAPTAPGLGVRPYEHTSLSGFMLPWILGLAVAGLVFCPAILAGQRRRVHQWRRFRPAVHLPAIGLLLVGTGLSAYVALALPPPLVGWLLALTAAATPWIALMVPTRRAVREAMAVSR